MSEEAEKHCKRCGTSKPLAQFPVERRNRDGRAGACRTCVGEKQASCPNYLAYQKGYYQRNREHLLQVSKAYAKNNAEKVSEARKNFRARNKLSIAKADASYYVANKSRLTEYKAGYYKKNRVRLLEKATRYYEENKPKIFKYYLDRARKDPVFRQKKAMRALLRKFLLRTDQMKEATASNVLGYTVSSLMARLSFQFQPGMGWHNYGDWHIDHKIPVSWFLLKGETRPSIVNALCNLQPLWAAENIAKGDKLPEHMLRNQNDKLHAVH